MTQQDKRTLEERLAELDPTLPKNRQVIAKLKYLIGQRDGGSTPGLGAFKAQPLKGPQRRAPLFATPEFQSQKPPEDEGK